MMTLDLKLARAAGRDAADRAMRAAGRCAWDEADWNLAAATTQRLLLAAYQAGGLEPGAQDTARGLMAAGATRQGRARQSA